MLPPHIRAMLHPRFYPHPTADIRLLQTHASYVVLTGPFAYKLKKPVDFGFLDYTSLEKRKHFCREELRLNRRFSPDLYVSVQGVIPLGQGFTLGDLEAPGAIDYCIQMRQFSQDSLLNRLATQKKLDTNALVEFMQSVQQIHAQSPAHGEVDGPRRVGQVVKDNFPVLHRFAGTLFADDAVAALEANSLAQLKRNDALLDIRVRQRKFRECHGDLHTGNVVAIDGKLRAFDAIEFSERFRIIDVLAELAFLIMDLEALGHPDEANRCMNVYLEEAGDWDGAPLLPLYLTYRALVRAKIAALTASDPQVATEDRLREEAKARTYFNVAVQLSARYAKENAKLTIMFGLSGSGKSTVARRLAAEQGGLHIRSDAVRKHLAGVPLRGKDPQKDIYTPEFTEKTFTRMLALAESGLAAGLPVILDGRYARRAERDAARAVAEKLGVPFQIVVCEAPVAELRDRLEKRRGDVSDATAELLSRQEANTEPLGEDELSLKKLAKNLE